VKSSEPVEFLLRPWRPVGEERVCSAIDIPNTYEFLRDEEIILERDETTERIASSNDRMKVIVETALASGEIKDASNPHRLERFAANQRRK
jgi:hypothetical protein